MEFRTLRADEIDVRVGQVKSTGYTLLLYKDARCDMNILDEHKEITWQRDHKEIKGNLYCGVGIYIEPIGWIWKWDCGTESNTEKEKGEASDSFKRACVNWGIGRELYTSPFIYVMGGVEQDKDNKYKYNLTKEEKRRSFKVKEIEYNARREITKLVIVDNKGIEVYSTTSKPRKTDEKQNGTAGDYIMPHGKHQGKSLKDISSDYLDWYLENGTSKDVKDNINLMRNGIQNVNVEDDDKLPF